MNIYISLIITMVFSAFFSGVEIAFVSVDKLRFEMERKGGITSRILSIFFKNPNEFISTMLVGNNIALVIYGILMAQIIGDNLLAGFIDNHFLMVLAQTVISTLIILVTGEFLPKTIFKINPNLVLNVFAIPLIVCYVVLYPISKLASGLSCIFLRLFGMKVNKDASDRAFGKVDLDYFVQSSIDNAENEEELDTEVKIFQNALDFSNIKIRDCIVPRTEVVAVDLTTSLDELKSRFIESGISKIIVYDGNIDNVVGYIHSSEMFRAPKNWHENVKQVPIVPETMSAHKLMKLFMQQKRFLQKRPCRYDRINREHQFSEYIGICLGNQRTNLDPLTRFFHRPAAEFDPDLRFHILDIRINASIRQQHQRRIGIGVLRRNGTQLKIGSPISFQQCLHFRNEPLLDIGPRKFPNPIALRLVVPGNSPKGLVDCNIDVLREAFYDMPTLAQRRTALEGDEVPARRFEQGFQRHRHPPVLLDSLRRKPDTLARLCNEHTFLLVGKRPKIILHRTT